MKNFILKHKIAITVFVLIFVFGFGWWVWATTVGTDIDISGSLKMSGTEVITSAGKLQIGAMPTGGNWDITSDLTIEGPVTPTFFVGRDGGTYAGRVGIGTATPAATLHVVGNISAPTNTPDNCAWTTATCNYSQTCPSYKFVVGVQRHVDLALCGSAPKQYYYMSLYCCEI